MHRGYHRRAEGPVPYERYQRGPGGLDNRPSGYGLVPDPEVIYPNINIDRYKLLLFKSSQFHVLYFSVLHSLLRTVRKPK